MPRWAPCVGRSLANSSAINLKIRRGIEMDRVIELIRVASAIALLVAITVGYGTVSSASAQGWCEEAEYCHWDTKGSYDVYGDGEVIVGCATSHCDTRQQWCCLDGAEN